MAIVMLFAVSTAWGEGAAQRAMEGVDQSALHDFAWDYAPDVDVGGIGETVLRGESPDVQGLLKWLRERTVAPLKRTIEAGRGMIAPALLLALLRCTLSSERGAGSGARLMLRMLLLLGFAGLAQSAVEAAQRCLQIAARFADAAAPVIASLLTAMGMTGAAALVSPAAALAGNAAENLFLKGGIALCRWSICTAIAGNLSAAMDLSRVTRLFRKAANWGAGLVTTLFTALIAIQGSATGAVDGVAVRAAKYAVDSAAPVIGSGVSDAWESYVAGLMAAKGAVGLSGIAALLAAGFEPVILCAAAMLTLHLIAALLEALGEREAARAAGEMGGVCQMALSLSTGALAIATVLLGAAMAAGKSLI